MATQYQSGFGNEFATEAIAGALPVGQNSPQKKRLTGFTPNSSVDRPSLAARGQPPQDGRIRPSVTHKPFRQVPNGRQGLLRSAPFDETPVTPNQLRWDPLPLPSAPTDFIDGLITMAVAAISPARRVHLYACNASMRDRFFYNADGETLVVPQMGRLLIRTELGVLDAAGRHLRSAARVEVPGRIA